MQKLYFVNKAILLLILGLIGFSVVSGVVDPNALEEEDQNSSSDAKWKRNIESEEGTNSPLGPMNLQIHESRHVFKYFGVMCTF